MLNISKGFCLLALICFIELNASYADSAIRWINECNNNNCEPNLSRCANIKCSGMTQCLNCLVKDKEECTKCGNDIFDPSGSEIINGTPYLICDNGNEVSRSVCRFSCRANFQEDGQCIRLNNGAGAPVCQCSSSSPASSSPTIATTPTTTSTTTTTTPKEEGIILEHTHQIRSLVELQNGDLASIDQYGEIRIWDGSANFSLKMAFQGDATNPNYGFLLGVLPNGDLVSGHDYHAKVWDSRNKWELKKTINVEGVIALAVLQNGDIVIADVRQRVSVWRHYTFLFGFENWEAVAHLVGFDDLVSSIIVLPNGDLTIASESGTITIWDKNSLNLKRTINTPKCGILLAPLPESFFVDICSLRNPTFKFWNPRTGNLISTLNLSDISSSVALNDDLDLLIGTSKGQIQVWESFENSFRLKRTLSGFHTQSNNGWNAIPLNYLTRLHNGRYVASASYYYKSIKIWEIEKKF